MTSSTAIRRFWILAVILASIARGSDFPVYWTGSQAEAFLGPAGDVDGDGMGDVILVSKTQPSATSPQQAFVRSGRNGSLLLAWTPSLPNYWAFGGSQSPAGDLNLDGFGDVALSVVDTSVGPISQVVEIRSGLDASVIGLILPPPIANALRIGWAIAGVGDLDGDGSPELLVSGNHDTGCLSFGQAVYNFEAPAFALRYFQTSWQCAQSFGSQIGRLDDVDGDGLPDFYVGAPQTDVGATPNAGWIGVYSGASGSFLTSLNGTTGFELLGGSVAALGDLTGDGNPEVAILRLGGLNDVAVLSLPNFTPVYVVPTALAGEVKALGDADGDGLNDFLVRRSTGSFPPSETVTVFSGASGAPIGGVAQNLPAGVLYPWGALGDVNGDGLGDFATTPTQIFGTPPPIAAQGLWSTWSWPLTDGAVRVYVSPNLRVAGAPTVGGTLQLQAVVPKHPGRPFQVVFAQDYASPGIPLGPFLFPIVPDAFFWASLSAGIGGTLNANGQGTVTIPVPNSPALHGLWLSASGVVYDPTGPLGIGCVLTHAGFQIP